MKHTKVSLYVRESGGKRRYIKVKTKRTIDYPDTTVYVLRYGTTFETLQVDSFAAATTKQMERELALRSGWRPAAKKAAGAASEAATMLDAAIDQYLAEIEAGRKRKTFAAYSTALRYFFECSLNKELSKIDRSDMLKFTTFLRDAKEQAPRSVYNKFEAVMTFLKHFDVKPKIKAHDWPKYVEEEPEIYEQGTLDTFFAGCDPDELLLFEFFLMTGMREQEVIYATDRCLEFSANTVSVKHNPEYGWTPKQYKERSIPVPAALMTKLKKTLVKRGKGGLLFPTKNNQPKFDFLDMAKATAKRAGIPESEVWLHKFRATFATRALWAGVDLRTVQSWMGHTDLASTLRYLKPNNAAAMREKVEGIWR